MRCLHGVKRSLVDGDLICTSVLSVEEGVKSERRRPPLVMDEAEGDRDGDEDGDGDGDGEGIIAEGYECGEGIDGDDTNVEKV